MTLHCHVDLSLGRPPNDQWKRRPGRPRERWIDQVRKDNGIPPADLWRRATSRGHRGATLRPSLASGYAITTTTIDDTLSDWQPV